MSSDPNIAGSLPFEVKAAQSGQTIGFAVSGAIEVTSEMKILTNLTIDGTGANVTVSGAIYSNALSKENTGGLNISSTYSMPIAFYSNQAMAGGGGAIFTADNTVISNAQFGQLTILSTGGKNQLLVYGNSASGNGGAISAGPDEGEKITGSQTLQITNSIFTGNWAAILSGGAIFTNAVTDVEESDFFDNDYWAIVPNGLGGLSGGAIAYVVMPGVAQSSLTINLDYFESNYADKGGGLFVSLGGASSDDQYTVKVTDSTFYRNIATTQLDLCSFEGPSWSVAWELKRLP